MVVVKRLRPTSHAQDAKSQLLRKRPKGRPHTRGPVVRRLRSDVLDAFACCGLLVVAELGGGVLDGMVIVLAGHGVRVCVDFESGGGRGEEGERCEWRRAKGRKATTEGAMQSVFERGGGEVAARTVLAASWWSSRSRYNGSSLLTTKFSLSALNAGDEERRG